MTESDGPGGLDLGNLLHHAKAMQTRLQDAQSAAEQVVVEGKAGGGMVVARANGKNEILRISIEQTLMDTGDREMIEDLVTAAVNQALSRAHEATQAEMQKATGGLNLPVDISKLF